MRCYQRGYCPNGRVKYILFIKFNRYWVGNIKRLSRYVMKNLIISFYVFGNKAVDQEKTELVSSWDVKILFPRGNYELHIYLHEGYGLTLASTAFSSRRAPSHLITYTYGDKYPNKKSVSWCELCERGQRMPKLSFRGLFTSKINFNLFQWSVEINYSRELKLVKTVKME